MARNKRNREGIRRKTRQHKDRVAGNAPSNTSPQIGYGEGQESPASSELDSSEHQDSPSSSDSDSSEQVFENRGLFEFSKTKEYWNDALGKILKLFTNTFKKPQRVSTPRTELEYVLSKVILKHQFTSSAPPCVS